jgi:hypothetical protein
MFQNITGGYVLAGFHEVMVTEQTKTAYEKAAAEGKITWRVSSTMFTHFENEVDCTPMKELEHLYKDARDSDPEEFNKSFPSRNAYDILMEELGATNMVDES